MVITLFFDLDFATTTESAFFPLHFADGLNFFCFTSLSLI